MDLFSRYIFRQITGNFFLILVTLAFELFPLASFAQGQSPAGESATAAGSAQADPAVPEEETHRYTLDLGDFKINDLRPIRNQTAKLKFSLHLAFTKSLTESQIKQLKNWKHRLRDQVITSVRITQMKYFQERDLAMLRSKILMRVNRLFKAKLAEDVLLTKYLYRTH